MASAQQCCFYFYRVICGLVLYFSNPISSSTSTCISPSLSLQGGEKKNWWGWQQIHHQSEWEQFQTVNTHEELLQGLNQTHPWPVKSYLPKYRTCGICLPLTQRRAACGHCDVWEVWTVFSVLPETQLFFYYDSMNDLGPLVKYKIYLSCPYRVLKDNL